MDVRVLVALVSVCGVLVWVMLRRVAALFFPLACMVVLTSIKLLREARTVLVAYGLFVLLWTVAQLLLYLLEHPGAFEEATTQAISLGDRLFILLGLAMAVPLATTPLVLGRAATWFLDLFVRLSAVLCRVVTFGCAGFFTEASFWRVPLALSLVMAFFPRTMRAWGICVAAS